MINSTSNANMFEFNGLSSDKKPINKVPNAADDETTFVADFKISGGSIFFEIDTCKVFMFDEEGNDWVELE